MGLNTNSAFIVGRSRLQPAFEVEPRGLQPRAGARSWPLEDANHQPHHADHGLLRAVTGHLDRVTSIELFFDLVYVFAITQLAHHLSEQLGWRGAFDTTILLFAVWWAWVYTAWITNWFDPDQAVVRIVLIATMLVSLVMSASIPEAFGDRGLIFAATYTAIQVGRSLFAVAALGNDPNLRRNFERITIWSAAAGVAWIAGGFAHNTQREVIWLFAVIVDYAAPASGFTVPGLGRSTTADWTITGGHLAERCQAFILIALGESVLDTGAAFGEHAFTATVIAAFVLAFAANVVLWWIYFSRSAEAASIIIARSADPGRLGRSAYTYFHLPMVAGIIVTAVAIERLIAEPTSHATTAVTATVIGGAGLFLAGHFLFKWAFGGHVAWSHVAGIVALLLLAPLSDQISLLALCAIAAVIVGAVAAWDMATHRRHLPHQAQQPVQVEES